MQLMEPLSIFKHNILNYIFLILPALITLALSSCESEKEVDGSCEVGKIYCIENQQATCTHPSGKYEYRDCAQFDQICVPDEGCLYCQPNSRICQENKVAVCNNTGDDATSLYECPAQEGYVCSYGQCIQACQEARENRSYLGCEYWAVDLDNALVSSGNAAAQQFSVVVSNPGNLTASIRVDTNLAEAGWPAEINKVDEIQVPPEGLEIINLPAREVDGSPEGTFDTGTHSAHTTSSYRITSNLPIAAYQFNPLENVDVFSNDASILFPKGALDNKYLVLSWPQTIAETDNPNNDFNENLRTFLTVVATEPGTNLTIKLSTDIMGDNLWIPAAKAGETITFDLQQYEVLNLETNAFQADFTGTTVQSNKPVAVFAGSEASDVPVWDTFYDRYCCADHLEHQLFPASAAGMEFVAVRNPPRTPAIAAAGGENIVMEEGDIFRIMALKDNTTIFTTLPAPNNYFTLNRGEFRTIDSDCDPIIQGDKPLFVAQFRKGQGSINIPLDLPGGDPSFVMIPPVEQWRRDYVFLTPNKYAFDFITIISPPQNELTLDYLDINSYDCQKHTSNCSGQIDQGDTYEIINCQLSYPIINPELPPGENIDPGFQDDGYHVIRSEKPIGLIVTGFDKHVSYGYVGGMDMKRINLE